MYDRTYGFAFDKGKNIISNYWDSKTGNITEPFHQEELVNGEVKTKPCGTNYGKPYDIYQVDGKEKTNVFDCTYDGQCSIRFSGTALCNKETGFCYEGNC